MDLCVGGLSKGTGPLTLPPLATGVCPVQKTQTYTGGKLAVFNPTQITCSQFLQDSHWTIGWPSSCRLQTQRVLSLEMLLRSVDGVVRPSVLGEPLKELE
jgi:hypothetical protein